MKKNLILGSVVAASMMVLVGCGGSSDEGEVIVGTWHHSCFQPIGETFYMVKDLVVRDDNSFASDKSYYNDSSCTQKTNSKHTVGSYKTGKLAEGDDGKPAIEIDLKGDGWEYYQMYRFLDNGNLLTSGTREGYDGLDASTRADHFDSLWTGYTRVE